ncbi:MAG: gliding motility-associated protein GldE [Rikenellaceae bacterium]|nr:gliding motility-associated protein GldE [Rikenellaceae bacterium]
MTTHTVWLLVIVAFLLSISALISGSETAFFSLSPSDIGHIRKQNTRAGQAILRLLGMQDYLLATILIVNNLVNICIVILCNQVIDNQVIFASATWEFVIKVIIVTFLLLLFGEIMPKIFAAYNGPRFAHMVAVPLLGLKSLFRPFAYLLIRFSSGVNEAVSRKRVNLSMDELSDAIEITANQTAEEKQMLSGIVGFINTEVEEIMKPRIDIVSLDLGAGFERVKQVVVRSGFSRIPVYEESLDKIKGVLYVKDLIGYIDEDDAFEWQNLLRKPYFVPEHKKISDLLEEFQAEKVHMAIVVDEYGSTVGLVSLEDILEEIVGEISDESDIEETFYTKVNDSTFVFDGKAHISDLAKVLGLDEHLFDEVRGDAETLAGLLLELKKDFLKKGETLAFGPLRMTVEQIEQRRIDKVRVIINR